MTPTSFGINRRDALRRTAVLLGGAISAPTLAAMLAGCDAPRASNDGWTPRALSSDQGELVAAIAEHILPETDTPGARSVGVHRFIDQMLADYYSAGERARFLAGLVDVDARAQRAGATSFVAGSTQQQIAVLTALDRAAYPQRAATGTVGGDRDSEGGATESATAAQQKSDSITITPATPARPAFFRTMKELTLLGYYTSEIGATKELHYLPVPGRFEGCVPIARVGRAWAV